LAIPKKHADTVDLSIIDGLAEIILRAGDLEIKDALALLKKAYEIDDDYDNVVGISVLFRIDANVTALAKEGNFPHKRLSISFISKIKEELSKIGCELVLFITPMPDLNLPDHHTLAIRRQGVIETGMANDAAGALQHSFLSVDNPYRRRP
jgi:hypothetical protein